MIALPVLPDRVRKEIGRFEVHRQLHAQQLRAAPRNVGIAAEIAVDLQGKGRRRKGCRAAAIAAHITVHLVHQSAEIRRADAFLKKSPRHQPRAVRRSAVVKAVLRLEPRQQLLRPFDRPRHQLREIGHKQRKIKKVMLRLHFPPVHIDGVAEGLERVERDAHRQNDVQHRRGERDRHRSAERRERRAEEIEILEKEQQPQIHRQTDRQKELLLLCSPLHAEGTEVVHRRRI